VLGSGMAEPGWVEGFLAEPSSALFVRVPAPFLADFLSDGARPADEMDPAVGMFCPACRELYAAPRQVAGVGGAAFGADYIARLLDRHPEIAPAGERPEYVPRVYGFRIFRDDDA